MVARSDRMAVVRRATTLGLSGSAVVPPRPVARAVALAAALTAKAFILMSGAEARVISNPTFPRRD